MLRDRSCPKCGAPGLEATQPLGMVVCRFCGNTFAEDNSIACPNCETINPPDAAFCKSCGEELSETCPACGTHNWAGADYCSKCGRNLSSVTALAERHAQGFKGVLQQQRTEANALKQQDESASQQRLAGMWEKENERQAHLARQRAERDRQQKRLMNTVIGIAVIFFLIFACVSTLLFLVNR